jgi:hypothetical protein
MVPEMYRDCLIDVWRYAPHSSWDEKKFFKTGGSYQMRRMKTTTDGSYDIVKVTPLFQSTSCQRFILDGDVPFPSSCCPECKKIFNDQVIQRLVERRLTGLNHHVSYKLEFTDWIQERAISKALQLRNLRSAHYRLLKRTRKNERWRQKITNPTILELMKQVSKMEKMGFHLGADNPIAKLLLENIKNEFSFSRTGNRKGARHKFGKELTTAINFISGGLAASGVLVEKLQLKMSKSAAQRGNAEAIKEIQFKEGVHEDNIEYVLRIYQNAKGEKYKDINTLLELSWDETPNIQGLLAALDDDDDKVLVYGFCGEEGDTHKCFSRSVTVSTKVFR